MQLSIRDYRGVERADIQVAPIALVTGLNGAGKTSIIMAAAAVLTSTPMPAGMPKKDAALLVRSGAGESKASITGPEGVTSITWPAAEPIRDGRNPFASEYAAGLSHVLDLDVNGRAKVLSQYLKTMPTKAEFARALADTDVAWAISGVGTQAEAPAIKALGLDPMNQRDVAVYRIVEKVWPEIESGGWDGALKSGETTRAKMKGAWEQITGKKWGEKVAAAWSPAGYDDIPAGATEQHLAEAVTVAKAELESTIRRAAVAALDLDGLRAKADGLAAAEKAESAAKSKKDAAYADLMAWNNKAPPLGAEAMACPHCGGAVAVKDRALVKVEVQDAAKNAEIVAARAEFDAQHAQVREAFNAAKAAHEETHQAVNAARAAKAKLEEATAAGESATEQDVAQAKAALAAAEAALKAHTAKREADAKHKAIMQNQAILDVMAPDGLRKRKLTRVLEDFNEKRLLPLCQDAGFKPVTIGDDLQARYGGRPLHLCSESEEYRARVVVQVAMAQIDDSAMVVIDRADMLDPKGRNGLLNLLLGADVPALVGMTVAAADKAPDLAAHELGATYWVEGGQCQPVGSVKQGRAA